VKPAESGWSDVTRAVAEALDLPVDARSASLATSCPEPGQRAEAERLLRACEQAAASAVFDSPALHFAAPVLAEVEEQAGPVPGNADMRRSRLLAPPWAAPKTNAQRGWRLTLPHFPAALRERTRQAVEAGEIGERLMAKVRLLLMALLALIQLTPLLELDSIPARVAFHSQEAVVGRWLTGSCLLVAILLWLAVRYAYRPWMAVFTVFIDVTAVSAGLAVFLFLNRPLTAVNSRVVFEVYFLAIASAGLRYDWRLCVAASALAVTEYLGLSLYAANHWDLALAFAADSSYGPFGWGAQVARLVVLVGAGVIGAAVALLAAAGRLEVEARAKEVRELNSEVRRQVAERARNLADSLMRLPDSPSPIVTGDVIEGRYRVLRPLGQGGMGVVHEVERLDDGRRLALKMILGVADRSALARFAREAQLTAQLDHPNLVATLDLGVTSGEALFLVMELVAGTTLQAERARYGDMAWAMPVLVQVARALTAMHGQNIVHRDLKPSNVLLEGVVAKVGDFGIAALLDEAAIPGLTRTGMVIGTPTYMAPELAQGVRAATAAADIFSFGVLCYEVLTRRLPHAVPPVLEARFGHSLPAPEPVDQAAPSLPKSLARLIDACLQVDPASRPTARSAVTTLQAVSPDSSRGRR
jgi:hypothetical protein